jgi:hypothetical protein
MEFTSLSHYTTFEIVGGIYGAICIIGMLVGFILLFIGVGIQISHTKRFYDEYYSKKYRTI